MHKGGRLIFDKTMEWGCEDERAQDGVILMRGFCAVADSLYLAVARLSERVLCIDLSLSQNRYAN